MLLSTKALDPFTSVAFTFATPTPLDFGDLAAGDVVIDVDVVIETTFDDPTTILAFGLVSSPGGILPSNTIDPTQVGTYNNGADVAATGADAFRLQVLPGVSTQGSGRVIVTIRRA